MYMYLYIHETSERFVTILYRITNCLLKRCPGLLEMVGKKLANGHNILCLYEVHVL